MSENHTILRIFVASPGGLDRERKAVSEVIERINHRNSSHWKLQFRAIGWEDTIGGNRRAQDIINRDLETCDYFFGIMADRWGSPPQSSQDAGTSYTSGFHEEYDLAQRLFEIGEMKDILIFFKDIPEDRMQDPGPSLQQVLNFRKKVQDERKPLYTEFDTVETFKDKIGDTLTKIGWENIVPTSNSYITASIDRSTEETAIATEDVAEENDYVLPQKSRDFLTMFRDKYGGYNTVTGIDVARLRLISSSMHRAGNDISYLGVHDTNLLFQSRSNLDLSNREKSALLTTGLKYMETQNAPFWYWTDGDEKKVKAAVQMGMLIMEDDVTSSALKIAQIFGYRIPNIPKDWFDDKQSYKLRQAAERYLSSWTREEDILFLNQIREEKSGQMGTNLDCIIICAMFRKSQDRGLAELQSRNPETLSSELYRALRGMIPHLPSEILGHLAKLKADSIRLESVVELARRRALTEELAEELSGDSVVSVRFEAIKALSDMGIAVSDDRAKEALITQTARDGLGYRQDGKDHTEDTSKYEEYSRYLLRKTLMVSAEPPRSMKLVFGCRFCAVCGVESLAGWVWWRRRRVSVVLSVM